MRLQQRRANHVVIIFNFNVLLGNCLVSLFVTISFTDCKISGSTAQLCQVYYFENDPLEECSKEEMMYDVAAEPDVIPSMSSALPPHRRVPVLETFWRMLRYIS